MIDHVLTISGDAASADGQSWQVPSTLLARSRGSQLFEALFPRGPGREWYRKLDPEALLLIQADAPLSEVEFDSMEDGDDLVALTCGVVRVVEGSEGETLNSMGFALEVLERPNEAERCYEEALARFQELGDRMGEVATRRSLARLWGELGRQDAAEECYSAALEVCRQVDDRAEEARTLTWLADTLHAQERWDEAEEAYRRAVELYREAGDRAGEAGALGSLGALLLDADALQGAEACLEQSLAIFEKLGDADESTIALCNLASVQQGMCENGPALETIQRALRKALQGDAMSVAQVTLNALLMGSDAAMAKDFRLMVGIAEALSERMAKAGKRPRDEDVSSVLSICSAAMGIMVVAGYARCDPSHPAMIQAREMTPEFDKATDNVLRLSQWLDEVCGW